MLAHDSTENGRRGNVINLRHLDQISEQIEFPLFRFEVLLVKNRIEGLLGAAVVTIPLNLPVVGAGNFATGDRHGKALLRSRHQRDENQKKDFAKRRSGFHQ